MVVIHHSRSYLIGKVNLTAHFFLFSPTVLQGLSTIIIMATVQIACPQKLQSNLHNIVVWTLQAALVAAFSFIKIAVCVLYYPLILFVTCLTGLTKLGRVLLSFVVGGLQGVFKSLGMGVFGEKVYYAILKQNGQYLKLQGKSLEEVFTCQLYDYSLRKFLSIPNLDRDLKISELQFWSSTGLNYLKRNLSLPNVWGLHSSPEKLSRTQTRTDIDVGYQLIDYSSELQFPKQDVFIFFNRSKEADPLFHSYVDMIKILTFMKKNLNAQGYAVFGNCFTSQGEVKVFEELLAAFGLKVEMEEDITRNILHSRKVLSRIHKNRKVAWLAGRARELISQYLLQCAFLNRIWSSLQKLAGLKQEFSRYKIYILEHDT